MEEHTDLKGSHLTLDCVGCSGSILEDSEGVREFLEKIVVVLGMLKLHDPVLVKCPNELNSWDQGGVSAP